MKSSYTNTDIDYGDIISSIAFSHSPKIIVEIGILDGFSLEKFANSTSKNTKIFAYDIFDEFNGNSANLEELKHKFRDDPRITIEYGDFYKLNNIIPGNVDIIHVDIANDGDIYEFAVKKYLNLLSKNGILLLEGGSPERDEVEWMKKYNKTPINPVLKKFNSINIGNVPSLTLIKE